ncbi:hypothetical protein FHG87_009014 [Trinorchestia longiramus]|nr:hypothetical protein FHG87_009014 [Trinorchestia longiramus]
MSDGEVARCGGRRYTDGTLGYTGGTLGDTGGTLGYTGATRKTLAALDQITSYFLFIVSLDCVLSPPHTAVITTDLTTIITTDVIITTTKTFTTTTDSTPATTTNSVTSTTTTTQSITDTTTTVTCSHVPAVKATTGHGLHDTHSIACCSVSSFPHTFLVARLLFHKPLRLLRAAFSGQVSRSSRLEYPAPSGGVNISRCDAVFPAPRCFVSQVKLQRQVDVNFRKSPYICPD